jgi:hypothetical protein
LRKRARSFSGETQEENEVHDEKKEEIGLPPKKKE